MVKTDKYISKENLWEWDKKLELNLETITVKKGTIFLEQSQKCDYFYFISEGLTRMFYYDLEGQQVTHWFSAQDMMITSPDSFFHNNENILNFEALEESELILVTLAQFEKISKEVIGFEVLFRNMIVDFALNLSRRVMSIQTESAEYRYLMLIKQYPTIFQRTKLSHIASYLGVTQQSLSRIRRKLVH